MEHPSLWLSSGLSILCGGLIGLERQLRGKPAGIRTSILICLATQVFVQMGMIFDQQNVDPTRVIGQVVTGIGFLGAGVILSKEGLVIGVTSAAVIWMLAAIGVTIAVEQYKFALGLTLISLFTLWGMDFLEYQGRNWIQNIQRWQKRHSRNGE